MGKNLIEQFLSFTRFIFFDVFSPNFNAAYFKNIMDFSYIIFEKIAYSFEILSSNYLKLYEEIVEKEIKMVKIPQLSNILIIGCGSLPVTPLLIGIKTYSNIVAIDYDKKAIQKATIFIKKYNLKSNIIIEYADGLRYTVKNFDIIFVLYGIKKQKEMLIYLSKNIENNTQIIFRTNHDTLEKKLGGTKFLSNLFEIKDFFNSDNIFTSTSYLLIKKDK